MKRPSGNGGHRLQVHVEPEQLDVVVATGGLEPLQALDVHKMGVHDDAVDFRTRDEVKQLLVAADHGISGNPALLVDGFVDEAEDPEVADAERITDRCDSGAPGAVDQTSLPARPPPIDKLSEEPK